MMKKVANIVWKSPSNIAFIKYWGKSGNQYPKNPSLSMTLDKCHTITSIDIFEKNHESDDIEFSFTFEGKENKQFTDRINKYFYSINERISIFRKYKLSIGSNNSFPHSAGIASSASAMSALALCLSSLEQKYGENKERDFIQNAAVLARLGSGSATRSLFSEYSIWGEVDSIAHSSNDYGIPLPFDVDKSFKNLRDTILIIDNSQKKVSSSAGHALMNGHPYADQRYINARSNLKSLIAILKAGDFDEFARILELEALSLHSLMLTANPWYSLLSPNTLTALERIRYYRDTTRTKIAFTLDAGPNVHLIYPEEEQDKVKEFIASELKQLCMNGHYIQDNIGRGPEILNENYL
jgi:diphosphomevalonate decarboxylase